MKTISLVTFLIFFMISVFSQEGSINGVISFNEADRKGEVKVEVIGTDKSTTLMKDSSFSISGLEKGPYRIKFSGSAIETKVLNVEVTGMNTSVIVELEEQRSMDIESRGIAILSEADLEGEEGSREAPVSGILQGSRDVFSSKAGYTFGPMRFRVRGYESKYTMVYMNGLPMNNMERGQAFWGNWGGLNDVLRNKTTDLGVDQHAYGYGNIGGASNIDVRASHYRKGGKATYSLTNRSYRQRAMFKYSSGLDANGWAYTFAGSRRWAEEGYKEGSFYDAWSYFLAVEKKFNSKHSLNFTAYGAPSKRGKSGASTQEVYDMVGNNYYNPYWGYQNGEVRNSRVSNYFKPTFMLNHYWNINEKTSLTTSAVYRFGRGGGTALTWYNAADPRPDYYRKLPSYITNPDAEKVVSESFANDPGVSQIDWQELYQVNYQNMDTIYGVDGKEGNTVSGKRSQYMIEERRYDQQYYVGNMLFDKQFSDRFNFKSGIEYRHFISPHYKNIADLLGGDFWLDKDKFAERESVADDFAQSDIRKPNHVVEEGDLFGYHYDVNISQQSAWAQSAWSLTKINFYFAGNLSNTNFWRTGYMKNGKFPESSIGNSSKHQFLDIGLKTGAVYKFSGRYYLKANAGYKTQAPTFRNSFISPRTRDHVQDNLTSEKMMTGDIGLVVKSPVIKATMNFYYTQFEDQLYIRSFYHDGYRNFVNYVMSGIDKTHMGIEAGLETKITSALSLTGMSALGFYKWTSRPKVNTYIDNSSDVLEENETVFAKGFLVEGTPQTVSSLGIKYFSSKYWFGGVSGNYVDDIYLSFNPVRRTKEAVDGLTPEDPNWQTIIGQEQLPAGYTLDLFLGKSFKFDDYYATISLNVSNALDNKEIITGGYEQFRYDMETQDPGKFPPKYYYYYGRTYYLNVNFRF